MGRSMDPVTYDQAARAFRSDLRDTVSRDALKALHRYYFRVRSTGHASAC